ncbi:beta-hydroxyacyl-ACP dehydratase, putative [Plasmodium chabaudi adami]|uniref:3-hydroxyacyl-[acyl-carrier-protein] dehydratase n=1 Tax=Plasmodium chabaudi adami TaxID=5826 RepID=A0A1C6XW53_PLACE|nr:beta-hydroxyacyl-ACP dehydratase, putative [Plasmodium chabaudi adami]
MMKLFIIFVYVLFPVLSLGVKKKGFNFLFPSFERINKKNNLKKSNKGINKNDNIKVYTNNIEKDDNISAKIISSNIVPNLNSEIINIDEIKNILPHRYPFLLVDKVLYIQPNKKIIGIKNVTANEEFFNGHFPQKPIMPGVLQIEALAQLGGILCLKNEENKSKDNLFLFAGVDGVKWKKPVRPGDTLVMEVEQILFKPALGIAKLKGVGYVGNDAVIEIEKMIFAMSK